MTEVQTGKFKMSGSATFSTVSRLFSLQLTLVLTMY